MVCVDCRLCISSSERHVEVDKNASLPFRSAFTPEKNIMQRDVAMQNPNIFAHKSLMPLL